MYFIMLLLPYRRQWRMYLFRRSNFSTKSSAFHLSTVIAAAITRVHCHLFSSPHQTDQSSVRPSWEEGTLMTPGDRTQRLSLVWRGKKDARTQLVAPVCEYWRNIRNAWWGRTRSRRCCHCGWLWRDADVRSDEKALQKVREAQLKVIFPIRRYFETEY